MWDLAAKRPLGSRGPLHRSGIEALAFSRDDSQLATAGWDEALGLWDVVRQRDKVRFRSYLRSYHSVAFSPDGQRVAAGTGTGAIKIWDTTTYQEVATLKHHTEAVKGLEFADDDTLVSYTEHDLRVWRAAPFALAAKP